MFRQGLKTLGPKLKASVSNGNIEFLIGGTMLGYVGYSMWQQKQHDDMIQQTQQQNSAKSRALQQELRKKYLRSVEEEARVRQETLEKYRGHASLFQCEIMVAFPLDGQMGLRDVKIGDVVDVLEDNVGPGGAYNLCRVASGEQDKKEQVGWYPIQCMQKIGSSELDLHYGKTSASRGSWLWWKNRENSDSSSQ